MKTYWVLWGDLEKWEEEKTEKAGCLSLFPFRIGIHVPNVLGLSYILETWSYLVTFPSKTWDAFLFWLLISSSICLNDFLLILHLENLIRLPRCSSNISRKTPTILSQSESPSLSALRMSLNSTTGPLHCKFLVLTSVHFCILDTWGGRHIL